MISTISSQTDQRAESRGCRFDKKASERVRTFFRRFLRHSKGQFAGQKFEPLGWQWEGILRPLFGWKRPDGTRRYRRAYIEIPKKNGKSTLCAGIGLYLLIGDSEPGAEVYSAAADRDQAGIVFNEAAAMVKASPALASRLEVVPSTKRIISPGTTGYYKALSAEAYTKEGLNIHGLIFDEFHAQPNRDLYEALKYGGAARRQPLYIYITTAGYDRHSVCYEMRNRAMGVIDGSIDDDSFFAYIAGASDTDDWTDPAVWRACNPSYGVTITESDMAEACSEAQQSPTLENAFRRYRLDQWTEQETRWINLETWAASGNPDLSPADLDGEPCRGGLDLASTTDIAAFVLYFPRQKALLPYFWVPRDTLRERERANRVPLTQWVRAGLITATDGNVIDYDIIRRDINTLAQRYHIGGIAADRWNSSQLVTQLQGDGFDVAGCGQGYTSMSSPTKEFERLVLQKTLTHFGNPVLRWMVGNVSIEQNPAGDIKPSRSKSREKIDGVVASIMALWHSMIEQEKKRGSVYDRRGIVTL